MQKMRRWAEYERSEEADFTKTKLPEHWEIVFRLRRKRGVKSQLLMTVTADIKTDKKEGSLLYGHELSARCQARWSCEDTLKRLWRNIILHGLS